MSRKGQFVKGVAPIAHKDGCECFRCGGIAFDRTGLKDSKKTIEKRRQALINRYKNGPSIIVGRKHTKEELTRMRGGHKNRTPEMIKNMLRRNGKSTLEVRFENIITKNNLPYKFVGNGDVVIGRKVPDFINTNGQKIAVEVFYQKHKETFRGGLDKWKLKREKIFNEYGYKLLFFNELEVNEIGVLARLGERDKELLDSFSGSTQTSKFMTRKRVFQKSQ